MDTDRDMSCKSSAVGRLNMPASSPSTRLARRWNSIPSGVRVTPWLERVNSGAPTFCSRSRMILPRRGWEMNRACAARLMEPVCATVIKYSRCSRFMPENLPLLFQHLPALLYHISRHCAQ